MEFYLLYNSLDETFKGLIMLFLPCKDRKIVEARRFTRFGNMYSCSRSFKRGKIAWAKHRIAVRIKFAH